jgi:hypothetical protein
MPTSPVLIVASILGRANAFDALLHQGHPLRLVEEAAAIRADADSLLESSVNAARRVGATWQDVGSTLNISRQAAQQRFGQPADLGAQRSR